MSDSSLQDNTVTSSNVKDGDSSSMDADELVSVIDEFEEHISDPNRDSMMREKRRTRRKMQRGASGPGHSVEYWSVGKRGRPEKLLKKYPAHRSSNRGCCGKIRHRCGDRAIPFDRSNANFLNPMNCFNGLSSASQGVSPYQQFFLNQNMVSGVTPVSGFHNYPVPLGVELNSFNLVSSVPHFPPTIWSPIYNMYNLFFPEQLAHFVQLPLIPQYYSPFAFPPIPLENQEQPFHFLPYPSIPLP